MKYCRNCKVNVNARFDNCPLCGSWLEEEDNNDNCTVYKEMENDVGFPVVKAVQKVNFLKTKFNKIMLSVMAVAVVLNMLLTPKSLWSAFVVIGGMFVMFCIMMPIAEKAKIQTQIKSDLIVLTLLAFAMELTVLHLDYQWFVITNVLPWIYAAAVILVDLLILFRRYEDKGLFMTLAYCTIYAIAPQIVLWIAQGTGAVSDTPWWTFVIFFAALLNLTIVLIVCTRSLKEEVERNFNI